MMNRFQKQVIEAMVYYNYSKPGKNRIQKQIIKAYTIFEDTYQNPNNRSEKLKRVYYKVFSRIDRMRSRGV